MDRKVRDSSGLKSFSCDRRSKCALEKIHSWTPQLRKLALEIRDKYINFKNKRKVSSAPSSTSRQLEKNQNCEKIGKSSVEDRIIIQDDSLEFEKVNPPFSTGSSIQVTFHSNFNQCLGKRSLTSVDDVVKILTDSSQSYPEGLIERGNVDFKPSGYVPSGKSSFNDSEENPSGKSSEKGIKKFTKPPEKEKTNSTGRKSDSEPKSSSEYFYLKAKEFQHFQYILHLTRDCIPRLKKIRRSTDQTNLVLPRNVYIRIGIVGKYTEQNLSLLSKRRAKIDIPEDTEIWKESPLICFQNDLSLKSAMKILQEECACHKILIISKNVCDETYEKDESIFIATENKEHILSTITTCLEEPISLMLKEWYDDLKKEGLSKQASGVIAEIGAIRKQMKIRNSKDTSPAFSLPSTGYKCIVPEAIKDYLFGRSDVNAFGIWGNSSFKVFVKLSTDKNELRDKLKRINLDFFVKYPLDIENGKFVEKQTLKQGDPVMQELPDREERYVSGTLGGFVTTSDGEREIYALSCNHIFPLNNQPAYAEVSREYTEIGTCVFTTRDKSCDFAAVKVNDSVSEQCDVTFRRDDRKKRNARVYTESLENLGLVHKIGAETNVTNGVIISSEFYNTLFDDDNRECLFLVKGNYESFSKEGDSGSLVFARSMDVQQSYVEVLGMVYGNDIKLTENDHGQNAENPQCVEYSERKDKESMKATVDKKPTSNTCNTSDRDDDIEDRTELSACYRINTALELFKENQGNQFQVKFRDDVTSSSSSDDSF